jgi:hypothetical protein
MEDIIIYLILLFMLTFVILTVIDILKSRVFTRRIKTNYLFLVCIIPFVGSLIYYIYLKNKL